MNLLFYMWFLVKLNFCLYKAHKNLSSLFFVFDVSVLFIPVLIHSSEVKFASEVSHFPFHLKCSTTWFSFYE